MSAETETLLKRGLAAHQMGKIADARTCYEQVLAIDPSNPDANHLLGVLKLSLGQAREAADHLRKALRLRDHFTQARVGLGHALVALGDIEGAVSHYRQAVEESPRHLEALCHLARHLQDGGKCDQAIPLYRRALELKPDFPQVHHNLGGALLAEGEAEEALKAYQAALKHKKDYAEAKNGEGAALLALRRPKAALEAAQEAIRLRPKFPEAHNNLGNVLLALNQLQEAEAAFRLAVSQKPGYAEALSNLGNTLLAMNRHLEAKAAYEAALQAKPDLEDASYNLGLTQLALGEFEPGWERYELRWRSEMKRWTRDFAAAPWKPEASKPGESLLLHAEQGLGDTLQFVRYVERVRELGLEVVLEVQPPLKRLIRHNFPGIEVVARGNPLPLTTWRLPLLSLPRVFRTRLASVPAPVAYLHPDEETSRRWRERLATDGRRRVGVVWAGNPNHRNDHNRSLPVQDLVDALTGANVSVYSLQKECRPGEEPHLRSWHNPAPELHDFMDTAGLVSQLDLVISVDTSVAHLAGALGRPVWVLLPFAADWRWLVGRSDSPWYPSMRLFRQIQTGRWSTVLESVRTALREPWERDRHLR